MLSYVRECSDGAHSIGNTSTRQSSYRHVLWSYPQLYSTWYRAGLVVYADHCRPSELIHLSTYICLPCPNARCRLFICPTRQPTRALLPCTYMHIFDCGVQDNNAPVKFNLMVVPLFWRAHQRTVRSFSTAPAPEQLYSGVCCRCVTVTEEHPQHGIPQCCLVLGRVVCPL